MHDPLTVAHEIIRPWPRRDAYRPRNGPRWEFRHHHTHGSYCQHPCTVTFPWWKPGSYCRFWVIAGRRYFWPALVTIWHAEPRGADAGSVCHHYRRWQDDHGQWHSKAVHAWRWHIHHWRIQVNVIQGLRRRLLTRCAWCGGRDRNGDRVNVSPSWDAPPSRWWRGEKGLYHHECLAVADAHGKCLCPDPLLSHGEHGQCVFCGGRRAYRRPPDEADRLLASLPKGSRITDQIRPGVEAAWAQRRARREGQQ